jgi:phospholipase C
VRAVVRWCLFFFFLSAGVFASFAETFLFFERRFERMTADVKHVVVLMLENRSFDHVLGSLYRTQADGSVIDIDGNTVVLNSVGADARFNSAFEGRTHPLVDTQGAVAHVAELADFPTLAFWPQHEPNEEHADVAQQFFNKTLETIDWSADVQNPTAGFAANHPGVTDPLSGIHPRLLPALTTLASEYGVCDSWHASVPTQTWANRLMAFSGSSAGIVDNHDGDTSKLLPYLGTIEHIGKAGVCSIMAHLDDWLGPGAKPLKRNQESAQVAPGETRWDWAVYAHGRRRDLMSAIFGRSVGDDNGDNGPHYRNVNSLAHDALAGSLPAFSVIEPAYFPSTTAHGTVALHNDHHPNPVTAAARALPQPPVWEADKLVLDVYRALFVGEADEAGNVVRTPLAANDTLLIVVYDEHGGTFDHVPLPRLPPPHNTNANATTFQFQFGGARVPAILVSPRIAKHTVLRAARPFDHTSIISSLRERFRRTGGAQVPPLTRRDEEAPTVWSALSAQVVERDAADIARRISAAHSELDARLRAPSPAVAPSDAAGLTVMLQSMATELGQAIATAKVLIHHTVRWGLARGIGAAGETAVRAVGRLGARNDDATANASKTEQAEALLTLATYRD